MQIITITSSNNRSGGTRQAIYQNQELARRGHNVTLCLPHNSSFWDQPKHEQDSFWVALPNTPSKHKAFLESLFSFKEPTIIHAFHNKAIKHIAWWGLSWIHKGIACVAHRGVVYRPRNPFPYLSPAIKAFIINSQACAKSLAWHCPQNKIHFVPNGLPNGRTIPNISKEEARKKIGDTINPKILFGFVGNNKPQKGFDLLLKAFAKANIPDAHLLTMGIDPNHWGPICKQLGIHNNIHHLGQVEHIADYLQLCDVFVVPSQGLESSPNTLIEAMSMGLPIIATHIGGIPDLIKNNGILVSINNTQSMTDALVYMTKNIEQRVLWGKQSLLLSKKYSIISRCDALEKIYSSISTGHH